LNILDGDMNPRLTHSGLPHLHSGEINWG
jgi:hypothetical protein